MYGKNPEKPVSFTDQDGGQEIALRVDFYSIEVLLPPRGFTPRCEFYPPVRGGAHISLIS